MTVSYQFIFGEAAEAERTRDTPFPPCSSHSPVGGDLPFDEDTRRAFRDKMWRDENIYISHLDDESP